MSSPEGTANISNSEYLKEEVGILFSNNMQYYLVSQSVLELTKTGNFNPCRADKEAEKPNS